MIPSLKMLMLSQAVFIGVQVQHQEGSVSCIFCGGIDQCNHYFMDLVQHQNNLESY